MTWKDDGTRDHDDEYYAPTEPEQYDGEVTGFELVLMAVLWVLMILAIAMIALNVNGTLDWILGGK